MRKILTLLLSICLGGSFAMSQTPTYSLEMKNGAQTSDRTYEFDIYLAQTGSNPLELSSIQSVITYNTAIANSGTISFSMIASSSELGAGQFNFVTSVATGKLQVIPNPPSGSTIVPVAPGLKVGRFRITNTVAFAVATPNLAWRSSVNPFTKVNAIVAAVATAITTDPVTLTSSLPNAALPIELVSFTAMARGRNIDLSWATKTEINNYGFDVERKAINNQQSTINNWEKVGFVEGKGTTNTPQSYSYSDIVKSAGTFTYRLKQTDRDGKFTYSPQVEAKAVLTASDYKMSQNYPNPFNPSTKFNFAVSTPQHVSVKVFNSVGQEVQTLFNGIAPADQVQEVTFDGARLASGIYFYVLRAQDRVEVKKMMMMK